MVKIWTADTFLTNLEADLRDADRRTEDEKSPPDSKSTSATSEAFASGLFPSFSSSSLSSESSSCSWIIAYTPRRVLRSFTLPTAVGTGSESLRSSSDAPASDSQPEASPSSPYPPRPFFSHVSQRQYRFLLPTKRLNQAYGAGRHRLD